MGGYVMDHLPDQNEVEPQRSTPTPAAIIELATSRQVPFGCTAIYRRQEQS
jgi:hypothetical protein